MATSSNNLTRGSVRGKVKPTDIAVAAYHPYQEELVGALWQPRRSVPYYNIVLPEGMHLERPTLGPPAG